MTEELIDRIYECSVVPEYWPGVLDDVAALANSDGGLLFSARKALNWTASERGADIFAAYVEDGWFGKCSRRLCLMSQDAPSFFVEHDFWTDAEIDADPVYRDFFRPRGLGWSAGTGVQVPTGDNIVFSVERAFADGPIGSDSVARLNALRPHLARSALVSARLQHKRAEGAAEALAALQLPAFLLRACGEVPRRALIARAWAGISSGRHKAGSALPIAARINCSVTRSARSRREPMRACAPLRCATNSAFRSTSRMSSRYGAVRTTYSATATPCCC